MFFHFTKHFNYNPNISFVLVVLFSFILGCREKKLSINSETIFSIPIGVMRNEINLFTRENFMDNVHSTSFTLTPLGNYFIVDVSSRKILYYNNYGKINFVIYNPAYRYESNKNNAKYLDRSWPFGQISEIAAGSSKLYVVSTADEDTSDRQVSYHQNILAFDFEGKFLYRLGTEGRDSRPFRYHITKLFISELGDLFVISKLPDTYQIYKFSNDGKLLQSFELSVELTILENPAFQKYLDEQANQKLTQEFFVMNSPNFSYDGRTLFFELYRYIKEIHETTNKTKQIRLYRREIYSLELEGQSPQKLKKNFTIRNLSSDTSAISAQISTEEFMGTTGMGFLVFLQLYRSGEQVVVYYDQRGNRQYAVDIGFKSNIPYKLHLAKNGLVSALYFHEDRLSVVWWRTDKLFSKELSF